MGAEDFQPRDRLGRLRSGPRPSPSGPPTASAWWCSVPRSPAHRSPPIASC
jgi:hypothetical protein